MFPELISVFSFLTCCYTVSAPAADRTIPGLNQWFSIQLLCVQQCQGGWTESSSQFQHSPNSKEEERSHLELWAACLPEFSVSGRTEDNMLSHINILSCYSWHVIKHDCDCPVLDLESESTVSLDNRFSCWTDLSMKFLVCSTNFQLPSSFKFSWFSSIEMDTALLWICI